MFLNNIEFLTALDTFMSFIWKVNKYKCTWLCMCTYMYCVWSTIEKWQMNVQMRRLYREWDISDAGDKTFLSQLEVLNLVLPQIFYMIFLNHDAGFIANPFLKILNTVWQIFFFNSLQQFYRNFLWTRKFYFWSKKYYFNALPCSVPHSTWCSCSYNFYGFLCLCSEIRL